MMRVAYRLAQGLALWALMLSAITAVLLAANAGSEHCNLKPSFTAVGCFLGKYEGLAAGLLGAAGTIFAAWIA
jgi:hypothetical protein